MKTRKNIAMWILMVLVALWIVSLPAICKAETKPWTTGEKTVLAWSIAAVAADMFTTCRMLDNPYNYEMNPALGRHPSDGRVVLHLSISHLICVAISHWVPRR